jgi:hypothetical protein
VFEGFYFGIPAVFMTFSTIGLGGVFVLLAWFKIIKGMIYNRHAQVSTALYTFTAAVGLQLVAVEALPAVPYGIQDRVVMGVQAQKLIGSSFLAASFVLLLVCMVLARRDGGRVGDIVQIGAALLIAVFIIGFSLIILSLPGMPLR